MKNYIKLGLGIVAALVIVGLVLFFTREKMEIVDINGNVLTGGQNDGNVTLPKSDSSGIGTVRLTAGSELLKSICDDTEVVEDLYPKIFNKNLSDSNELSLDKYDEQSSLTVKPLIELEEM